MTKPIDLVVDLDRILELAKETHERPWYNRKTIELDPTTITAMAEELKESREALKFYADVEKMYDTAHDSDGSVIGYVRGVDPYDSLESDMGRIEGTRLLHHGVRARKHMKKWGLE